MKKLFFSGLLMMASLSGFSQSARYIHPSTIEILFSISDFQNPSPFLGLSKSYGGLGLNFTKGIKKNLDFCLAANFMYADSVMKGKTTLPSKELLGALDISMRWRPLRPSALFQPFLNLGTGVSAIDNRFAPYLLAGPGLQVNVSQEVFAILRLQRRVGLNDNIANHYFYSIGLAGNIGRRHVKKPTPPPAPIIPQSVIADRDKDGTPDSLDLCIDVPGIKEYHGCPDTDRDGIPDNTDRCPNVPGMVRYNGCPIPDTDKDGVNDEEDSCINEPGLKELHGCPPQKKDITQTIERAAKNIFFKTASFQLLPESFPALDTVTNVLKTNPSLRLSVEGHTDNVGTDSDNKLLSQNRAKTIVDYLITHGIQRERLTSVGYGEEKPIATNDSETGRSINRRVELKIIRN